MNPRRLARLTVFVLLVSSTSAVAAAPFDRGEYAARRSRLMEKIGDGAAIFLGATTPAGDVAFRQGHDFILLHRRRTS